jgi:hypothetical protein
MSDDSNDEKVIEHSLEIARENDEFSLISIF